MLQLTAVILGFSISGCQWNSKWPTLYPNMGFGNEFNSFLKWIINKRYALCSSLPEDSSVIQLKCVTLGNKQIMFIREMLPLTDEGELFCGLSQVRHSEIQEVLCCFTVEFLQPNLHNIKVNPISIFQNRGLEPAITVFPLLPMLFIILCKQKC